MTNHIGEELDFLDRRQQNAIYDIMKHEAEALEYILDDPKSILDELKIQIGENLELDRGKGLTDEEMENTLGFGRLYDDDAIRKRVLKKMNEFDPDHKVTKRAIDEWQLNFHRDYDATVGIQKEGKALTNQLFDPPHHCPDLTRFDISQDLIDPRNLAGDQYTHSSYLSFVVYPYLTPN